MTGEVYRITLFVKGIIVVGFLREKLCTIRRNSAVTEEVRLVNDFENFIYQRFQEINTVLGFKRDVFLDYSSHKFKEGLILK